MKIKKTGKNRIKPLKNTDTIIVALSGEESTTTTTTTAEPTTTTTTIDPLDQEVIPGVTLRQYWSADEYDGRR